MTFHTLPGIGIQGGGSAGDAWLTQGNGNWLALSSLTQLVTIGIGTTLPGSPTQGTIYILSAAAGSHPTTVAVYDTSAWTYYTPGTGWKAYNTATSATYLFNGTDWVVSTDATKLNVSGGTGTNTVLSGGTVSGAIISGGTSVGTVISGGTIVSGSTVTASGATISGGVLFSGTFVSPVVSAATLASGTTLVASGATITNGVLSGTVHSGGSLIGVNASGGTFTTPTVSGATLASGTTFAASGATITNGTISGTIHSGGSIVSTVINVPTVSGGTITNPIISGGTLANNVPLYIVDSAGSARNVLSVDNSNNTLFKMAGSVLYVEDNASNAIMAVTPNNYISYKPLILSSGGTINGALSGGTITGATITNAIISGGSAINMASITTSGSFLTGNIKAYTGTVQIYSLPGNTTPSVIIEDTGANPTNYIQLIGEVSGTGPIINVAGGDTNINLQLQAKGTGSVTLNGSLVAATGLIVDASWGYPTGLSSGSTYTATAQRGIMLNYGTFTSLSIVLPPSPSTGQQFQCVTLGAITTITITGGTGGAGIVNPPTTMTANSSFEFTYQGADNAWWRTS